MIWYFCRPEMTLKCELNMAMHVLYISNVLDLSGPGTFSSLSVYIFPTTTQDGDITHQCN